VSDRGSIGAGATAYTGPVTPLRAALVGEHPTRTLAQLQARARLDAHGRLVLDMALAEAHNLVRCLDGWCDREDDTRARQRRDRSAPLTTSSKLPNGEWHQEDQEVSVMSTAIPTTTPAANLWPARRSMLWVALAALVCGGLVGGLFALGSGVRADATVAECADRQVVVGLSSAERSPDLQRFAVGVVTQVAVSAAVCARSGEAFGVAGGGQVFPLLSSDDVARFAPRGPNRAVRLGRLDPNAATQITKLVADRLHAAYRAAGEPTVSSVAALYAVAAEHASRNTDVILVTVGVNHDTQVDLNHPLAPGEGQRLAETVSVPRVGNRVTTVVGVAQMDATRPVPGPSWPAEIRSFNDRVCRRSGARRCRLFSVASVAEALHP
jgi:hypothetical protein